MGWDASEVSLHFITVEGLRPVLFIENLSCLGPTPRCFPGASTWGSQGLAAAERGSSVQSTSTFIGYWRLYWGQVVRGRMGARLIHVVTRSSSPT